MSGAGEGVDAHLVLDVWGAAPDVHRGELEPTGVHCRVGLFVLCDDDNERELPSAVTSSKAVVKTHADGGPRVLVRRVLHPGLQPDPMTSRSENHGHKGDRLTHPRDTIRRMCTSFDSPICYESALSSSTQAWRQVSVRPTHVLIQHLVDHIQQLGPRTSHVHICCQLSQHTRNHTPPNPHIALALSNSRFI